MYVNNNIHNNPHLLGAFFKTTLHTLSQGGMVSGTRSTLNKWLKTNPKALQENPAQQELPEGRGCWGSWASLMHMVRELSPAILT